MNVTKLEVKNFRNAVARTLELVPGRNAFVGANARGKTNLLEAIYVTGVGKSFRTPRDRELIMNGCDRATVTVACERESGVETVRMIFDRESKKRVAINDVPITHMSELMGVCPVVLFSPDGLKIVKDEPSSRRRFMDIALCQVSKAYFSALSRYGKILASRNRLLKSGGATDSTLAPWDELLADAGARIIKSRRGYIRELSAPAAAKHRYLSGGSEELSLYYEGVDGADTEEIKSALLSALLRDRESDYRLKYTHSGPHKDDIRIAIGGVDIRAFGSQGQQRTAALAMKLAETELLTRVLGTSPALLLDDVFSELDGERRSLLLAALDGFQSVITATEQGEMSEFGVNIIDI